MLDSELAISADAAPVNLLDVLWQNRWVVLGVMMICIVFGAVYAIKARKVYSSTSRVYIETNKPQILDEKKEQASKNYLYNQAELLKSTPILIEAYDICKDAEQMQSDLYITQSENPSSYIKRNLRIDVGKKNDIIDVVFESHSPAEAALVANAVVDSYINYNSKHKRNTSAEVLKILHKEKDKRNKELMDKLRAMTEFKKQNVKLVFDNDKGNIILERLASLSEAMTASQLETMEAHAAYKSVKSMMSDPIMLKQLVDAQRSKLIYISTPDNASALRTKLAQLDRQLDDLLRTLTIDHPAIISIEKKISKLKQQVEESDNKFATSQLAMAHQTYLVAKQKEEQIIGHFEQQRLAAIELNEQFAQYRLLESDWEQTKTLCSILDERIKELNLTEDAGALNIRVLEKALKPLAATSPQKARIVAMACVFGFMLGCGIVLVRDFTDSRFRNEEEVIAVMGVPVLGTVPSMKNVKDVSHRGQKAYLDSDSIAAEAYRKIRMSVFFNLEDKKAKTILVTSSDRGDGKTTMASNLAITMAQAGQKTLLIDADFRRPMLDNIFGIENEKGLTGIISGQSSLPEAITPTAIKGLDLMHCGPEVANPSELMGKEKLIRVLNILACKYDRIILDSPPIACVTDSLILASFCDATVLTINAKRTTEQSCRQVKKELHNAGANVLGVVVNDVSPNGGRYGYYRSHGYKNNRRQEQEDRRKEHNRNINFNRREASDRRSDAV